jgi:CDP-diacylglycerol--serine O-phosphatidyltransferase
MKVKRCDTDGGRKRRGVYLLPNLFTTASLFSGFYAIVSAIRGDYQTAAWAILVASVFDGLDGRIARMTGTTSRFGMEYDSLSDMVAFGVAPGMLAFLWGLESFGRLGWLAAFLYVATTALRLARFNAISSSSGGSSKYFLGLPCPAAAATVSTTVLIFHFFGVLGPVRHYSVLILVYMLSFLMVSNVRYTSFKKVEWFNRHPFSAMVGLVLAIVVLAIEPSVTLFVVMFSYIASGLLVLLLRLAVRKKSKVHVENSSEAGETGD